MVMADPSLYIKLMEEDENTATRREQLKGEMDKLVRAMNSINDLESSAMDVSFSRPINVTVLSDSEMDDAI